MRRELTTERLTRLAQRLVGRAVVEGAVTVDATVGNGHDILFLYRCSGHAGQVFGFDIQTSAQQATRQALIDKYGHIPPNLCLLQQCHSTLDTVLKHHHVNEVGAFMFNLGYLPGGDKTITTSAASTETAVSTALTFLTIGGVISIMVYTGQAGGEHELDTIETVIAQSERDGTSIDWTLYESAHAPERAPKLFFGRKLRESG